MQPSVAAAPSLRNSNGNGRIKLATVTKRNGQTMPYDRAKIVRAIYRCFTNSKLLPLGEETQAKAEAVTSQVDHLLVFQQPPVIVEKIQDLVETQLMAGGYYDAAKEYILYREEHRKLREERPVDQETVDVFTNGMQLFTGPNRHAQMFQAMDKWARFDWAKGRREAWPESVDRVMTYVKGHMDREYPGRVDGETWQRLDHSLRNLEAAPAMRLIQMAGPALERCQSGAYNCAGQFLREPRDFAEEMYLLCQGCGVGFSVEYQHAVDYWPRVRKQRPRSTPEVFEIPDETEGWCDALKLGMERWIDGYDVKHIYDGIRPANSILKTKGGRSSGPQPLKECLEFAREKILARQGTRLTSLDLHDINCYVHRISGVGGVRRSSGLGLSDLDDLDMRHCKDGQFWEKNNQRNQANNSAVYDERPSAIEFMEEWMALAKSYNGERGIYNRGALKKQFPKRRVYRGQLFLPNPCGEINLRNKQFCNLSIGVMRSFLDWLEVRRRVVTAAIWGTIQSTMTRFKYIGPEWKKNCEEERLLGVDLLGHMDHPLLRRGSAGLDGRLRELKELAVATNLEWAQRLGINPSAAVTCGKPSGDSSVFFDCAPGFKAWHGQYFIRRCRIMADNPVAKMLVAQGVPWHMDYDRSGMIVLDFPCKAPENAIILGNESAIEQLEHWKTYKVNYCEHNASITVYVKPDEWLAVGNWVYENWDIVGGLSFSPFDGTSIPLPPYEAISEEEYNQRSTAFPEIDWSKIVRYESEDMTTGRAQIACGGGACAL